MATPIRLIFTVTNSLLTDQRMQRICGSLAGEGYEVWLVGVQFSGTDPHLPPQPFVQKRLFCFFRKGPAFYMEYNLRLFFFLMLNSWSLVCAIDLDTILPCWLASALTRRKRVYDAHELFTEMEEVRRRPHIYKLWKGIEKQMVPRFCHGYTVNHFIAGELKKRYGVTYEIIRNLPLKNEHKLPEHRMPEEPFLLYQGAVNEGRSFETLIPAMQQISLPLWICGTGNQITEVSQWVRDYGVAHKVIFKGVLPPSELQQLSPTAFAGLTLFQQEGWNQYYSLANRFFDYMMAGIPQICVDYPEYRAINEEYDFALLIPDVAPDTIARAVNKLVQDRVLYNRLQDNTRKASQMLHWEKEAVHLKTFYARMLASGKPAPLQ